MTPAQANNARRHIRDSDSHLKTDKQSSICLIIFINEAQKKLRDETREFVKSIPRKMILDMDADAAEAGAIDEKVFE